MENGKHLSEMTSSELETDSNNFIQPFNKLHVEYKIYASRKYLAPYLFSDALFTEAKVQASLHLY